MFILFTKKCWQVFVQVSLNHLCSVYMDAESFCAFIYFMFYIFIGDYYFIINSFVQFNWQSQVCLLSSFFLLKTKERNGRKYSDGSCWLCQSSMVIHYFRHSNKKRHTNNTWERKNIPNTFYLYCIPEEDWRMDWLNVNTTETIKRIFFFFPDFSCSE